MRSKVKPLLRRIFYRSSMARHLIGFLSTFSGRTSSLGVSHLATYNDKAAIGPLQQPEALLLFGIVRTVLPMTIVEFGFYQGHSAFNFLQAMPNEAHLFSYDISSESLTIAESNFSHYKNFHFIHKSQADFTITDINNRTIDLLFFDASHDFHLNQTTFQSVHPALSKESIICIHDTGLWNKRHFNKIHHDFIKEDGSRHWIDDESYAHQNDERIFVNWIRETYPTFQAVHLHSLQALRHGISILQRSGELKTI